LTNEQQKVYYQALINFDAKQVICSNDELKDFQEALHISLLFHPIYFIKENMNRKGA